MIMKIIPSNSNAPHIGEALLPGLQESHTTELLVRSTMWCTYLHYSRCHTVLHHAPHRHNPGQSPVALGLPIRPAARLIPDAPPLTGCL